MMKSRWLRFPVLASIIFAAILALGPQWTDLPLSLLTIKVLRDKLAAGYRPKQPVFFFDPEPSDSLYCRAVMSLIDHPEGAYSGSERSRRLARYASLACDSKEHVIKRFDLGLSVGHVPDLFDAIYMSDIFERSSQPAAAMALRKKVREVSIWYVNLGRIEIERMSNESKGLAYFELAADVEPGFDVNKAPLYMYTCMISIRDHVAYSSIQSCLNFDRIKTTPTSRWLLGQSYYSLRDFDRAIAYFRDAVGLDPSFGDAYSLLAKSLMEVGNTDAARDAYLEGIAHASQYPWNYLELARLEIRQGCNDSARVYLEKMKALNSQEANVAADMMLQTIGLSGDNPACH